MVSARVGAQVFMRESTWGWRSDGVLVENGAELANAELARRAV